MNPVVFDLGFIQIRWYSLFILIAVLVAYRIIMSEAKRQRIKEEFVFNMLFWALIFGIIGARLYYVIFNFEMYKNNLEEIYKIWNGGLAIHGGMLVGLITILIYSRKYKANIKKMLDIIVPGFIIAQAIGRWGNFFNSEAYGSIVEYSTLVNMKIIPQFVIDNMFIKGAYRLPMFYFESLLCLIGFIIMIIIRRRKYIKNAQIFSFYLIWYGIIRFVIEIFRSDSLMFLNLKVAQIASILMVAIGIIIFILQQRKPILEDLYNKYDEEIKF